MGCGLVGIFGPHVLSRVAKGTYKGQDVAPTLHCPLMVVRVVAIYRKQEIVHYNIVEVH